MLNSTFSAPVGAPAASYRKYDYKVAFLDSILEPYEGRPIELLDMGCGTSKDFIEVLRVHPNVRYTGVECNRASLAKARENVGHLPNVTLIDDFGEATQLRGRFDLTVSLGVLEHVKRLDDFLVASAAATKSGGRVIHNYGLGHALHANLYERAKVSLCLHAPALVPARHFTTHPDRDHIVRVLEHSGVCIDEIEQSQMRELKSIMNGLEWGVNGAGQASANIIQFEKALFSHLRNTAPPSQVDFLFPLVSIYGTKRA